MNRFLAVLVASLVVVSHAATVTTVLDLQDQEQPHIDLEQDRFDWKRWVVPFDVEKTLADDDHLYTTDGTAAGTKNFGEDKGAGMVHNAYVLEDGRMLVEKGRTQPLKRSGHFGKGVMEAVARRRATGSVAMPRRVREDATFEFSILGPDVADAATSGSWSIQEFLGGYRDVASGANGYFQFFGSKREVVEGTGEEVFSIYGLKTDGTKYVVCEGCAHPSMATFSHIALGYGRLYVFWHAQGHSVVWSYELDEDTPDSEPKQSVFDGYIEAYGWMTKSLYTFNPATNTFTEYESVPSRGTYVTGVSHTLAQADYNDIIAGGVEECKPGDTLYLFGPLGYMNLGTGAFTRYHTHGHFEAMCLDEEKVYGFDQGNDDHGKPFVLDLDTNDWKNVTIKMDGSSAPTVSHLKECRVADTYLPWSNFFSMPIKCDYDSGSGWREGLFVLSSEDDSMHAVFTKESVTLAEGTEFDIDEIAIFDEGVITIVDNRVLYVVDSIGLYYDSSSVVSVASALVVCVVALVTLLL